MRAGDEFGVRHEGVPLWRDLLVQISDFADISTWALGAWVKPGWNEPLPSELVLDRITLNQLRGIPFLYRWRVDALDLTSLGAGFGVKAGASIIRRLSAVGLDLGLFAGGANAAGEIFGTSRKDDELSIKGEPRSSLYWLSCDKLFEQGYTSYDIKDGIYVFYRDSY